MSVVKINAITIPDGSGPELEQRFAARLGAVDGSPGFEEFCLLRPTAGETRYFVYTRWASEEDYQAWAATRAQGAHAGPGPGAARPSVATGATLLEFEVVSRTTA
ncbi:Heme-degrading monooxygenase HmoA [Nakamurella panacisegetis]|uniref:Heme-degrading monooxygenase HmoA n=1 Tax=Nakamurella panacisegetis TaxID=1090615 RepID=A0A1H0HRV2_9ACTN|nr:antibiotic biosynthesis monooxygenase [Nakamurella panacisegetis]SDO21879.1 Heme-degrading monooxygenase HmoA [Nakamurella panacisegetis]